MYKIASAFYSNGGQYNFRLKECHPKFLSIGKNVSIAYGARIQTFESYAGQKHHPKLVIEDNVCIQPYFSALLEDNLFIGHDTIIAQNCSFITNNHGMDAESQLPYGQQQLTTAPITVGAACWIGQNVTILPGVEIGKKCIVAAGSVVTKSIPPYSIAAGIPAKVIKKWNFTTHRWEQII